MDGKLRNMTTLYLIRGEEILLLYRIGSRVVLTPSWCGIGGHFEKEELNDARACVLREMYEEIGLTERDIEHLSLRYVTLRHKMNEVRQIYYFFAEMKAGVDITKECGEGILKWTAMEEIPDLAMPYTAKYVMMHYLQTGRFSEVLYGGIAQPEGVEFIEMKSWE